MDPAWLTIEDAYALWGAIFVVALRDRTIMAEGCRTGNTTDPSDWGMIPAEFWRRAIFRGEPGFPALDGRTYRDLVWVMPGRATWWDIRVRRADVEKLPKSGDVLITAAYEWLLKRAEEEQKEGRRLKQSNELWQECKLATGAPSREAKAAFQKLPANLRYTRGQH